VNSLPSVLKGTTRHYQGNGRKLGYPTANINVNTELQDGVYFGFSDLQNYQDHPTIVFIGTPVTMGDTERRVEAHLLDIEDREYYDLPITISVETFHRGNQHFASVEALQVAMKQDEAVARQWFEDQKLASHKVLADT
jgi:riboflavin kinase/FMN adenylyltransferase